MTIANVKLIEPWCCIDIVTQLFHKYASELAYNSALEIATPVQARNPTQITLTPHFRFSAQLSSGVEARFAHCDVDGMVVRHVDLVALALMHSTPKTMLNQPGPTRHYVKAVPNHSVLRILPHD